VTAASAGLSLSEDDGRVLRRIATAYSVGAHGARNILQRLAETTDGDAAAHLLGSMIELNRGRPHETERVLAIAEAVLGATVTQSARALAARPAEQQALDEISVTAPDGPADVATRDVRHMGALDNLFGRSKQ
jgi:esterase/lipase superfamily enzyme